MDKAKISAEVFERYMDASVELFMACYAETISPDTEYEVQEADFPQLNDKCKELIKATHRRKKLLGFIKGSGRVLKSAAMIAIAILALSSFLFITVEAVREPILNFYIRENEGNWELSNTPFGDFNEKDPLGNLLPDDFYLHSVEGNMDDDLMAIYYNDAQNVVSLQCVHPDNAYRFDTADSNVKQIKISGYDAIVSSKQASNSVVVTWYSSDVDRFIALHTDCLSEEALIRIAESLICIK